MSRAVALRGRKKAANCPNPSYGRVLGADIVGAVVTTVITLVGVGAGIGVARATDTSVGAGAFIGGGVGLLGSIYPSMLAQRATVRNDDCPNPGFGSILIYTLVRNVAGGTTGYAARKVLPKAIAPVVPAAMLFALPLLGRPLLRT